jgi:O-succinylbenzoic acid--CoA ligase
MFAIRFLDNQNREASHVEAGTREASAGTGAHKAAEREATAAREAVEAFVAGWLDEQEAVVAHTSGSTGAPKVIRLPKQDMRVSARATNLRFGINAESRLLCPLSANYIAGKMMIVRAMEADCEVAFCKPSNSFWTNNEVIDYINQGPVDLLPIVPSQCNALLEVAAQQTAEAMGVTARQASEAAAKGAGAMGVAWWQGIALGNIRNVIIGGATVAPEMERRLLEAMPAGMDIFATYGMTETCSHVALRPLGCDYFTAMPGISFGQDSRDCLTIFAPAYSFGQLQTNDIVSRYDKQQATTDNVAIANPQSAGNGQPASEFQRFRWLGRFDNVINTGGIKVFPEELERRLAGRLPQRFYIKGEPDEKWGEAVVLVTEPTALSDSEIREVCAAVLQAYQVPKRIRRIEEIPLTSNGKIRRI